ncbi:GNAT family N-acetyltransferase [Labilibacter sediminis]|nr:GNAT family N-acetyltransferase [Labilibacter sediminis]
MIEVIRYTSDKKAEWDEFVGKAKNGTFLFYRIYMEYHADRFEDYSLLLYDKGKLKSIFPANRVDSTIHSHQGLTFGGILTLYETDSLKYIDYFNHYNKFLHDSGIHNVIYKTVPQIYKGHFGDEELYAMYRIQAINIATNLSSCIDLHKDMPISRLRKRSYKKSINAGITTQSSDNLEKFWGIMVKNMHLKHNTKPVHSCEEMRLLKSRFPKNIKLLEASYNNKMVAGAILYHFNDVLKIQYAHASPEGKKNGAIDNIYNFIINNYTGRFIDFGTSNLDDGNYINEGLLRQKEGFGARAVVFKTYQYKTEKSIK